MPRMKSELSWRAEVGGWTGVFLLSRLIFYWVGVRFDTKPLSFFWQLIDPVLLQTDLARSLWHLHAQPPLLNLLIGLVLKVGGEASRPIFHLIFLLLSWAMGLAMLALMRRLRVPAAARWLGTVLFAIGPATVLYENHLFYTLPVAALLAASALFLHRWASDGRFGDLFIFWLLAAALVLTRSLYHPLWFVLLFGGLWMVRRTAVRQLAGAVALPALLLVVWFGRGALLFGETGGSSWLGMSLTKMLTMRLSDEELAAFAAGPPPEPILSIRPFRELPAYAALLPSRSDTGVPLLDQPFKSSGAPNFHHLAYVGLSRQYLGAAVERIRREPGRYGRALAFAYGFFFAPAHDGNLLAENRRKIRPWSRGADLLLGQWKLFGWQSGKPRFAWLLALGLPLLVGGSVWRLARKARAGQLASADGLTLAYLLFVIFWVALVGNSLEMGENHRFRYEVDPFLVVLAVLGATALWRRSVLRRQVPGGEIRDHHHQSVV